MSLFANIEADDLWSSQSMQQENGFDEEDENRLLTQDYPPQGQGTGETPGAGQRRDPLASMNGFQSFATPSWPSTPGCGPRRGQHSGDSTLTSRSVLGRHERAQCEKDWSPPTKARLIEYADSVASEYGISEGQRDDLLAASTLLTHKLIIVTFAALLRSQQQEGAETLQTYLVSTTFKEYVVGPVHDLFLDPKLSSYKTGFLSRLMRHIRLNPGTYRIPQEFRAFITTKAFTTAVSRAATSARTEIKRKMNAAWKKKTPIYDLVKTLVWKTSQEMTDDIWARCAWLQMKLIDYQEKSKEVGNLKREEYWDYIDTLLDERRDKVLEMPIAGRAAWSSLVFELALREHLRHCPAVGKKKSSATRLPPWQLAISHAVNEMDAYSQEELAGEENDLGDADIDDDADV
ncbi:hypothetical protein B0H10DRAFT_2014348 [Mycena sp. CBHHK59/15]|nr:hypothetical protein B0H10DRAFT_2014348 [Mycena sp. CBHHK59/15]